MEKTLPSFKNVVPATTELELRITSTTFGIPAASDADNFEATMDASPVLAKSEDTRFLAAAAI